MQERVSGDGGEADLEDDRKCDLKRKLRVNGSKIVIVIVIGPRSW